MMQKTPSGTIIIVDDEIEPMSGMRDFLSELGYPVTGFLSGREALGALQDNHYDLLITDLMMPEMDGITLMKRAKEIDPLIICIMVTGHASIQTAVEAMKEGAFDYITKPVDWKILRMIIFRALEVRRLMTSAEQMRIARDQARAFARRLAEVQEQERQRIALELHDGFGQHLIALNMNLNSLHDPLTDKKTGETDQRLTDSIGIVSDMTNTIRDIVYDFRPAVLDDFGLLAGIKSLANQFTQHTHLRISVQGDDDIPRLPDFVEITLYRIVQEALNNAAKHSQAENVSIRLKQSGIHVRLEVADDGIGFDSAQFEHAKEAGAWGLFNMRERAEAIGGTLSIKSERGKGTRVVVSIER